FILLLLLSHFSYSQSFYKEIVPRYHNVFVGVGPAFMYADNAGGLRNSSFKTRPAASLGYSYKANSFIEVKGTFGYQMLESQDPSYYSDSVLRGWVAANQAIGFKGNAYYLDIMPLFHLPFERHIDRGNVNIYAGVGLGVMFVDKEEAIVVNNEPMTRDRSMSLFYLPLRGGISYRIGDHGDLALEATVMASFSDDIDGNVGFNRYNDHLFQAQIVYKRYLSPFPFWNK
ncbi:MAG TPA: hypothetical protein VK014_06865, partial [Cyclobacteriaceae bacterium]|nr:hypothetical protein [Cyclobacteriaceae bacterium]